MEPLRIDDFWHAPIPKVSFGACEIPAEQALIPKQLGKLPLWSGKRPFLVEMEETYKLASERALTLLMQQELE